MTQKTKAEVREKFEGLDYPIQIIGRNVHVTDGMKKHALDKLSKIERLGGHVIDAVITLDVQKVNNHVDFMLNLNGTLLKVSADSTDMYVSIDQAIDRIKHKITRYLDKLHDHHKKGIPAVEMEVEMVKSTLVEEINDAIEEAHLHEIEQSLKPGSIVTKHKRPLKTLSVDEAIMKMDLSEEPFLVYRSEVDKKLKVIYKTDDKKHYGIIELPE